MSTQIEEAREISLVYIEDGASKLTVNGSTWKIPRNFHIEGAFLPRKNLAVVSGESLNFGTDEGVITSLKMYTGSTRY